MHGHMNVKKKEYSMNWHIYLNGSDIHRIYGNMVLNKIFMQLHFSIDVLHKGRVNIS